MDAESLVRLLGPSRVRSWERGPGYLLLRPPEEGVEVRVYRERLGPFSTELAWVFIASAAANSSYEALARGRQRGFLRKNLAWEFEGKDGEALRALLTPLLSKGEMDALLKRAKPEYLAIRVSRDEVYVKVVKAIVGPYAGSLREAYDLARKMALVLSGSFTEKERGKD